MITSIEGKGHNKRRTLVKASSVMKPISHWEEKTLRIIL